jgi:hypothetical protein
MIVFDGNIINRSIFKDAFAVQLWLMLAACLRVRVTPSPTKTFMGKVRNSEEAWKHEHNQRLRLSLSCCMINAWATLRHSMIHGYDNTGWYNNKEIIGGVQEHFIFSDERMRTVGMRLEDFGMKSGDEILRDKCELGLSRTSLVTNTDMTRLRMQCRGDMMLTIENIFIAFINSRSLDNDEPWRPRLTTRGYAHVAAEATVVLDEDDPWMPKLVEASKQMTESRSLFSDLIGEPHTALLY